MNIRTLAVIVICAVSSTSFAQSPTTTAAPAAAAAAAQVQPLATHNCVKPQWPDAAKKLTEKERNAVLAELEVFRTCIRAFSDTYEKIKIAREKEVKELQESAQVALAAARAAATTVNAAVIEYNTFSQETVKFLNKDVPPEKSPGKVEAAPPRPSKSY